MLRPWLALAFIAVFVVLPACSVGAPPPDPTIAHHDDTGDGGEGEGALGGGEGEGEGSVVGDGEGEGAQPPPSTSISQGFCPPAALAPVPCDTGNADCDGVDVAEPHADVLFTRAFADGDVAIFQIVFASSPFDPSDADFCDLLIDTDGDPSTGQSGGDGAGNVWNFDSFVGVTPAGVDTPQAAPFPADVLIDHDIMQIRMPLANATQDGVLRWAIVSAFGGSGGANDAVPNEGGAFLSSTEVHGHDLLCQPLE